MMQIYNLHFQANVGSEIVVILIFCGYFLSLNLVDRGNLIARIVPSRLRDSARRSIDARWYRSRDQGFCEFGSSRTFVRVLAVQGDDLLQGVLLR